MHLLEIRPIVGVHPREPIAEHRRDDLEIEKRRAGNSVRPDQGQDALDDIRGNRNQRHPWQRQDLLDRLGRFFW